MVAAIVKDHATAPISEAEQALYRFAVKLTVEPWACREADIARLRDAGWTDRAILELTLVVGYFAFVNRIAHGLGVELEAGQGESPGLPR